MLMPIKSRLPPDTAFDPETIRLLTTAFEKAWQTLNGSGGVGPHKDAQRDRLARLVIALATAGERDMAKLRDDAVVYMRLSTE
jgi:hypothetical protein